MITILTGPPGAGKGTQADLLVSKLGFEKLSTGDALRSQIKLQTKIGKEAESFMSAGKLVPDEVLLEVLKAELGKVKGKRVLLDGYPRNMAQVKTLETLKEEFPISDVVAIEVPTEELLVRICGRQVCGECGASYHKEFAPANGDGSCKMCGGQVVQRPDDSEEKARVRLEVYENQTKPILDYYKERGIAQTVDGCGDKDGIYQKIVGAISGV